VLHSSNHNGTCQREGYRGVGLLCIPASEDPNAVAQNSNPYGVDEDGLTSDLTCTGGYRAYCCSGFVLSSKPILLICFSMDKGFSASATSLVFLRHPSQASTRGIDINM
jgi:hypothetical protein